MLLVRTCRQTQNSSTNDGLDEVEDLIRDGRSASSLALLGTSVGRPGGSDLESCFRGTSRISSTNRRRGRGRSDCTAPRSDAGDADSLGGGTLEVKGRCGLPLEDACRRCRHQEDAGSIEAHDMN